MNHLSYSRRRFLSNSSMGLVAFSSMPGILNAMESMHGMPKVLPNKASPDFKPDVEFDLFANPVLYQFYPANKRRCSNILQC